MEYVTRAQWGARPPKGVNYISRCDGIFVHYTAAPAPVGVEAEKREVRGIQNYHMDSKGWLDIAYSWLVGQSGTIYEGRGWGISGGHTQNYNSISHAVCWLGNNEVPTDAALRSINIVVAENMRRYPGGYVKGHREVNSTSCPGDWLASWVRRGRPTNDPPPPPPQEEEEVKQVMLRDRNGKVWHCMGNVKVHVPTPDHMAVLRFFGVEDRTTFDATKLLESLGTLHPTM